MRYADFCDAIRRELASNVDGLTWAELRDRLGLPYDRACPAWTKRLEQDIGLSRLKREGRALVWQVDASGRGRRRA